MSIQSDLDHSMNDEISASITYRKRAEFARSRGDEVSAKLWEHIAEEEDGHYNEFKDRLTTIRDKESIFMETAPPLEPLYRRTTFGKFFPAPADYTTPGDIEYPPQRAPRPYPQTYGDWVSLAEDIKSREKDQTVWLNVNVALNTIGDEMADAHNVIMAKQYITQKAGELGIR